MPFAIPEKWKWLTIGEIIEKIIGGGTPSKACEEYWNGDIPWASVKDLKGDVLSITKDRITQSGLHNSSSNLIPKGTLIICVRMGLGKISINSIDVAINQDLKAIHIKDYLIDQKYFLYFYKSLSIKGSGSTVRGITTKDLLEMLIPMPPLEEQHRIVEKIKKLFEQIDSAEKAYNELSGPLSERFRQLCLEKAIQGKLVPQLESEPAVEQIGKAPEDVPFTIPEKWKWVCLSNLGKLSTGTTPKTSETGLYGGNFPFIKPGEISEKGDLLPPNQFLTEAGKEQARVVSAGAVLMVCIGTIGKTAIANVALSFNQQINAIDPKGYLIDPIYLHSVFRSSWFQSHVKALASATTIKIVNKNKWGSSYIPLPPLDEQHRIIEKLNELLGTVGQLENTVSVP